jgi:iron complex transport system ATP-binding protein
MMAPGRYARLSARPLLAADGLVVDVPAQGSGGGPVRLLHGVSMSLVPRELVGLIGPNGAGKTTLLRVLGGALRPTAGEVRLGGSDLQRLPRRLRARRLGQVPQSATTGIDFTALDVVLMGRYPHLRALEPEGPHDYALARGALAEVEMAAAAARRTSTLSAGERQRLLFARARCQEAGVLLCDEPTANLDLRHRALLFEVLRGFAAGGGAVLAAIHDVDLAARYCGRLILLAGGRVLADGAPQAVLTPHLLRQAYAVEAEVHIDPATGSPRVTVLGPA